MHSGAKKRETTQECALRGKTQKSIERDPDKTSKNIKMSPKWRYRDKRPRGKFFSLLHNIILQIIVNDRINIRLIKV